MDKMLYVGMNGASQLLQTQMAHTNNLANASTPGFRADFQTTLSEAVQGGGLETRFHARSGGMSVNLESGPIQSTGNALDVAINGEDFFVVGTPEGGEAYSRRGDFRLTPEGLLSNGAGQPVLGNGGPGAIPPHQSLTIGEDGTVSIVPLGSGPETSVTVDRIRLVSLNPDLVEKRPDGLLQHRDGSEAEDSNASRLMSGHLEGANVSGVESMIQLMNVARNYELQVKMMSTAREMADSATRMMRME